MGKRRKSGQGSIHLRKDGRWEGRYVIGYDGKGLPKTKNVLAKTKEACLEKLEQLKAACEGPRPKGLQTGHVTFGAWLDHWYQSCCKPRLRPTTQKTYENAIYQHLIPALGQIPLEKLSTSDLQRHYATLQESGRLCRVVSMARASLTARCGGFTPSAARPWQKRSRSGCAPATPP